jgi:hypothetical protein
LNISTIKENKKNIFFASVILFFTSVVSIILVDAYFLNLKKDGWVCHICQFDSELGWENKPNEKVTNNKITYTTNSLGLRSEEIDPSREHIVVLGDSVAMGVGVNDNETVSYYIQQETSKYQVITLAATGHSVDQYYLNLKKHLPKLNPKYIIPIIFSGNDWVETIQDNMWQIDKPFYKIEDGNLKRENPTISMYSCWNYFAASWFFSNFNHQALKQFLCGGRLHDVSEGKKLIDKLLEEIKAIGSAIEAKTLFVLSPTLFDYYEETCSPGSMGQFCKANQKFFSDFLEKEFLRFKEDNPENTSKLFLKTRLSGHRYNYLKLKEIMDSDKYDLFDLFNYYKNQSYNMGSLYVPGDSFHYSPYGNSLLAKLIVEKLNLK